MGAEHAQADDAAEQRERVEQREERALVGRAHQLVELERQAKEQVAEGHAEHQRRHRTADEQGPVPGAAPARIFHLAAVVEPHRPAEQREQHQQHRPVQAGESDRIDHRPGREQRAASGDEPHLVAIPVRRNGVDRHASLVVGLADEGHQCHGAHVEAIGQGEADQQHADQHPPDELEHFVIEHFVSPQTLPGWEVRPLGCAGATNASRTFRSK